MANRDFTAKIGDLGSRGFRIAGIFLIIQSATAVAIFEAYGEHQLVAIVLPVIVFLGLTNDHSFKWNVFTLGITLTYYTVLACAGMLYLNDFWPGLAWVAIGLGMWLEWKHR